MHYFSSPPLSGHFSRVVSRPVLLVASDDATISGIIRTLASTGCSIEVARSGRDALRKAARSTYCCAVLGPSVEGPLQVREVRGWFCRLYALPVVELTGHEDAMTIRQLVLPHASEPVPLQPSQRPTGLATLTEREWQVMRALIDAPSVAGVARTSGRSTNTVHNQLRSIYGKLGVHSIQELLGLMLRLSWTHRQAWRPGPPAVEPSRQDEQRVPSDYATDGPPYGA
jgi:FixJ family two-component response regulator